MCVVRCGDAGSYLRDALTNSGPCFCPHGLIFARTPCGVCCPAVGVVVPLPESECVTPQRSALAVLCSLCECALHVFSPNVPFACALHAQSSWALLAIMSLSHPIKNDN